MQRVPRGGEGNDVNPDGFQEGPAPLSPFGPACSIEAFRLGKKIERRKKNLTHEKHSQRARNQPVNAAKTTHGQLPQAVVK